MRAACAVGKRRDTNGIAARAERLAQRRAVPHTMAMPPLLAALLLAAQADPVAAAAIGLGPAEIEDDNGPDMPLVGVASAGCTVEVKGQTKSFVLDMTKAEAISLEDTFVYIATDGAKLAIVGDASKPEQAAKLAALAHALSDVSQRCGAVAK